MKVQYCIEILRILNLKHKTSAQHIASFLGISTRSVYRYIDELIISGIPIDLTKGRNGGISLDKSYIQNKHKLTV